MLRQIGISPDIILCRSELTLSHDVKEKISLFCNVQEDAVFECTDVAHSIYEVPLTLHQQAIEKKICQMLHMPVHPINLDNWQKLIETIQHPKGTVTVGIVGKYVQHQDAYKSIFEALQHGAFSNGYKIEIKRIESDRFDESGQFPEWAQGCDGYLVPGGFGDRGWHGKLACAKYCRDNKIPYFGICLGMQVLVVEFARNVLGLADANSTEMDQETAHPIISLLEEQKLVSDRGGTMRLGAYPCLLKRQSLAHKAYGKDKIHERHRHRYELNNKYKERLQDAGLTISGTYEEGDLCEIAEVTNHPWMVGAQFHPEFGSKPLEPHPLFRDFVKAMIARKASC